MKPMEPKEKQRLEAEKLYRKGGLSCKQIAVKVGVSVRSIERWRLEWDRHPRFTVLAGGRSGGTVDELGLVDNALGLLTEVMGQCARGEVEAKAIASIATALVKVLQYRRILQPPTAAELADQLIQMNISPEQFVEELKKGWVQRA